MVEYIKPTPLPTQSEISYNYPGEVELDSMGEYNSDYSVQNAETHIGTSPDRRNACILGFILNCFCGLLGLIGLAFSTHPKDYFRGWCISCLICAVVLGCTSILLVVLVVVVFGGLSALFASAVSDYYPY
jgi:hypothetical protein